MPRARLSFLFLNLGHFLDHFFMLIFATVAALRLTGEWGNAAGRSQAWVRQWLCG